jgi:hypothetical protein
MPIAALALGAAATIGGAAISAHATNKSTNKAVAAQLAVADKNNAFAGNIYDQNKNALSPFITRGNTAGTTINALLGLGTPEETAGAGNAFQKYIDTSDYAFQRDQGERGLGARLSAAGGIESGAARKAAITFGKNLDSGFRGQYIGALSGQQGTGLTAANALAGVGTNYVNNVTNNNQNAADATSNGALIKGNANAGFYSTIGNALGQFAGQAFGGGGFGGSFGKGGGFQPPISMSYGGRPTQYGGWI